MSSEEEGGAKSLADAPASSTGAAAVTACLWETHFDKSSGEKYYHNMVLCIIILAVL